MIIGGVRTGFSEAALAEANQVVAPTREAGDDTAAVTIDDDDTIEVDDALSCDPLADGGLRIRVHIALVADFVAQHGPIDKEAAMRATTVYLPEATIRMLPDRISSDAASLIAARNATSSLPTCGCPRPRNNQLLHLPLAHQNRCPPQLRRLRPDAALRIRYHAGCSAAPDA